MNFPNMFPPNNHHHLREKPDEHCQEITLFNNYHNNQHFGQPQEYFRENSKTASTIMQDGFDFASQKPELSKKRKAEDQLMIDVHGGGGRVVRPVAGKDKHSKVSTARGPRDRRLRLSPKTAIQFYDVQDRLGYDRPSKAIDWLIKEAKSAIDALDDAAAEIYCSPPSNGGGERRFSNDEKPVSGFGNFLLDGAAAAPPPSSSTEFPFHRLGLGQGFCASSGLPSTCQEIVDNNTIWEIDRLQRVIKAWNCDINGNQFLPGNNNTMEITNFQAAQPIIFGNSQMFHQREPLQSSIINYSPISPYFPVVGFPDGDELSSITAAATLREDGKDENYSKFQE